MTEQDEDLELLQEFCNESREALDETDAAFVALETNPHDLDMVNRIFRCFHTIKGNSAYFGLNRIKDYAHNVEYLLDDVRKGVVQVTPDLVDALLAAKDHMMALVTHAVDMSAVDENIDGELLNNMANVSGLNPSQVLETIQQPMEVLVAHLMEENLNAFEEVDEAVRKVSSMLLKVREQEERRTNSAERPGGESEQKAGVESKSEQVSKRTMRVEEERVDQFLSNVGEILNLVEIFATVERRLAAGMEPEEVVKELKLVNRNFQAVTDKLQAAVMAIRQVQIRNILNKLARIVRDTSRSLSKDVQVQLVGDDQLIDKSYVEVLEGPLVHMVRNAVDHGLETPRERKEAGKSEIGTVRMSYVIDKDNYEIKIEDDGRGMDPDVLRRKAVEKGVLSPIEAEQMTDEEALHIVFLPGFSTALEVTDVSGRGVGMDVVLSSVTKVGGSIQIESELGKGSTFRIQLPRALSLVVATGLLVKVHSSSLIIPMDKVQETLEVDYDSITDIPGGQQTLSVRGKSLPFVRLTDRLGLPRKDGLTLAVVVSHRHRTAAFEVDEALGLHKVVVKSLEDNLVAPPHMAGGAILGDGSVGLVLNVPSLLKN